MGEVIVVRHGETEWSKARRHTGRTDLPLTPDGEAQAESLRALLAQRAVAHTLVSPAIRARRTAELAGLAGAVADPDLWEWDYGGYEGRTAAQIGQERPGWDLWADGIVPGDGEHPGEPVDDVGARADAALDRIRPLLDEGDVAVVAHGHVLRVLTARWLGLQARDGRLFRLDTATISLLGTEHGRPVIRAWNVPTPDTGP